MLAVVAVFLAVGGPHPRGAPAAGGAQRTLILQALPTVATPAITPAAMAHELRIVRERLAAVSDSPHATLIDGHRIRVALGRRVSPAKRARILGLLVASAQLYFYDWEANALTPGGRTVAGQLVTRDPSALRISQGGGAAPGDPGSGGMSLYDAVTLAARQTPATPAATLSRLGAQYYLFGEPGSAACAAAVADRAALAGGRHCLLAGPTDEAATTARGHAIADLDAGLPAGVTAAEAAAQGRVLVVPQGTVVVQAANPGVSPATPFAAGTARFYVLRDSVALTGRDVTNPTAGTGPSGTPEVRFDFTDRGAARFQSVTARIAHRGAAVSPPRPGRGPALRRRSRRHRESAADGALDRLQAVPGRSHRERRQPRCRHHQPDDGGRGPGPRDRAALRRAAPRPPRRSVVRTG